VSQASGAGRRSDTSLASGLRAWGRAHFSDPEWEVVELVRPSTGWANETVIVTVRSSSSSRAPHRLVVRIPSLVPVFPDANLVSQARVLEAVGGAVPVPQVLVVEADEQWIGAPFAVMSHVAGRPGPEVPALDPWLLEASAPRQQDLHQAFVETLADVHAVDWRGGGLAGVLRGADGSLADEVAWWAEYTGWATDGSPPSGLARAMDWCATTVPGTEPQRALCWGDVRLGNLLLDDHLEIRAVLDWELASIGPAEMDLGWYLALEAVVELLTGRRVPGFLERSGVVAAYEEAAGRALVDLEWHELFALTRSVAISERLSVVAAQSGGEHPTPGGEANPVLRELLRRVELFPSGAGG